jgi:hypothetical protein
MLYAWFYKYIYATWKWASHKLTHWHGPRKPWSRKRRGLGCRGCTSWFSRNRGRARRVQRSLGRLCRCVRPNINGSRFKKKMNEWKRGIFFLNLCPYNTPVQIILYPPNNYPSHRDDLNYIHATKCTQTFTIIEQFLSHVILFSWNQLTSRTISFSRNTVQLVSAGFSWSYFSWFQLVSACFFLT